MSSAVTCVLQVRARDLPGSPGNEAALLGAKLGPLQPPLLPAAVQGSMTPRAPSHAVTSLKLQQNSWIHPTGPQWNFLFWLDLPGPSSCAILHSNCKFYCCLVLKLYEKRCFTQMDEIYFTFWLVMNFILCLMYLSPR